MNTQAAATLPGTLNETQHLRALVEQCIAEGNLSLALHHAELLWAAAPNLATAGFIKTRTKAFSTSLGFSAKRLAILRSFTIETMAPLVEAVAALSRVSLTIELGQYNAYIQELMLPANGPAQNADVVLVALHTRTAAPALWTGQNEGDMKNAADWLRENLSLALQTFRDSSSAPLLLQLLDTPPGATDAQRSLIAATNTQLRDTAKSLVDCYAFDIDDIVSDTTGPKWYDDRNWAVAKMPFRTDRSHELATRWIQWARPLFDAPCKVLVTDLDNTLWKGILGEDGAENLRMGADSGYATIQKTLLQLKERGLLLAVASKNDESPALSVLQSHPDCLMRPEHIVTHRINWSAKSANIHAMAEELGLGLDSFAFLDDNPAERAQVATDLPMVRILPHNPDPLATARMLSSHPELQRAKVSTEDAARTELYKQRRAINEAASNDPARREAFLQSLQQEVLVETLSDEIFARAADLERKTNQFNLRTRRFTEAQLRTLAAEPGSFILPFRVLDRFGDNGIVGLACVTMRDEIATIENFLMSCRVIGRDVELAMTREIARRAAQHGAKKLVGSYAPTTKNSITQQFYANAGFTSITGDGNIEQWEHTIQTQGNTCP